ncbi:Uncharacterized protein APZ42_014413, partial [Daphnia magna]
MFICLRYNTAFSTISVVSLPVDHAPSPQRCLRRRLHLHLRLVIAVFVFISVSSSSPSPSSPSPSRRGHRLGRLCPRHHLVTGFAFAFH